MYRYIYIFVYRIKIGESVKFCVWEMFEWIGFELGDGKLGMGGWGWGWGAKGKKYDFRHDDNEISHIVNHPVLVIVLTSKPDYYFVDI